MNLPTIEMEKGKAQEAYDEYRQAVKERHDEEDRKIARAYKALTKGTPLLRLPEVMRLGGTTTRRARREDGRDILLPKLAVARADGEFAWTNGITTEGALLIQGKREIGHSNQTHRIDLPAGTFDNPGYRPAWRSWGGTATFNAMIPVVPPSLRPKHSLRNYHLLFEADWREALGPPPGDPALLKHIGGDLYALVAVWDLSPVEQAVLAGRELA
jgi:hypothetical protein